MEPFEQPDESVQFASEAVNEFHAAQREFFEDKDLAKPAVEKDEATGEDVFKMKITKPIPLLLRRKATEAITTARHSMDQSIYAAITCIEGKPPKQSVYFPLASSPNDLESIFKKGFIPEALFEVIRGLEPYPSGAGYPGGSTMARQMCSVANNKHTVGLSFRGKTTGSTVITGPFYMETGPGLMAFPGPMEWDSAKQEIIICRGHGLSIAMLGGISVSVEIVIEDPKLDAPLEAVMGLLEITGFASEICRRLRATCEAMK
ncbi:MAG: hypothetical protein LCH74_03545 [Proteobacteria bacterium]|nr:hypothetical protein [Pseudomonadota bacterium]